MAKSREKSWVSISSCRIWKRTESLVSLSFHLDSLLFSDIDAPFNSTMTDTLHKPYDNGVKAVFYYYFVELDLTAKPPDANRGMIEFMGHFDVYRRY